MSEALPPDVAQLLKALIIRSTRDELPWRAVGDRVEQPTEFVYTGEAGSVSIASDDGDGRHPFTFALLTREGVRADSWTSWDNDEELWLDESKDFEDLYNLARRSSAGSTTLVKDLLREIGDIPF